MSMSTMTPSGEAMIPNGWTGQIDGKPSLESKRPLENRAITEALQKIDRDIEQLLQLRARLTGYGFSKICPTEITTVTEDEGLVLGAKEKNPTLEGTIANKMERIKESISVRNIVFSNINAEHLEGNYSNGYKIGSIAIINLDVYFKDILQGQKFKLFDINCAPDKTTFARAIGTNNKYCDFELDNTGTVFVVSSLNYGNFNIRSQILFKTKQ